jgi:microcystin degradation protein MlrC
VALGVHVAVVSRKMQAHDQALFRYVGVQPANQRLRFGLELRPVDNRRTG